MGSGELSDPEAGMVGAGRCLKPCVISSGPNLQPPGLTRYPLCRPHPSLASCSSLGTELFLPSSMNQPGSCLFLTDPGSLAPSHE